MKNKFNKFWQWFDKEDDQRRSHYISSNPTYKESEKIFYLHLENIKVGELTYSNNKWCFKYAHDFKSNSEDLNLIVGFPDVEKVYCSQELWPFFKIRIPGLKQPKVKEILKKENIEVTNDVKLLERFGKRTISNPYELETSL
ncbi:HipA N-terminal domain-containing protein [Aquiflexum balticum]|nr:HipA N-terminal domain-containing protein [Aquiflexum balticum]